jgi:uncharacterized RDD family membrane protein YckC
MTQTPEVPHNPYAVTAGYGTVPVQPIAASAWMPAVQPHQVPATALASPWVRLGATLLNSVLIIVTLGIGYLVWTLVLWDQGTNPGKKICGLRMVKADTGRTCTFGDMLVRNFVMGGLVLSLIGTFTFGIGYLVDAFMIFGDRRQRLIDKMAGTLVVQD